MKAQSRCDIAFRGILAVLRGGSGGAIVLGQLPMPGRPTT